MEHKDSEGSGKAGAKQGRRKRLVPSVVAAAAARMSKGEETKDDSCPFSQRGDQELADGLRQLASGNSKWTAAIVFMLDGKQWEALRTGRVFQDMQNKIAKMAGWLLKDHPAPGSTTADLSQAVLTRLPELDLFRTFVASQGTPGGFLNGVFGYQLRDAIRSASRLKNRPQLPLYDNAEDSQAFLRLKHGSYEWSMADLREQVTLLPPDLRSAVIRRHPELGLDEHLTQRQKGELKRYRQGLALLRENMTRYDRD